MPESTAALFRSELSTLLVLGLIGLGILFLAHPIMYSIHAQESVKVVHLVTQGPQAKLNVKGSNSHEYKFMDPL
jgi:hypothetical protein